MRLCVFIRNDYNVIQLAAIEKYPGDEITFTQFREIIDIPDMLDWTLMKRKK